MPTKLTSKEKLAMTFLKHSDGTLLNRERLIANDPTIDTTKDLLFMADNTIYSLLTKGCIKEGASNYVLVG